MFENKKIFILGFARSGYACAKLLLKKGCKVLINDNKDESKHDSEQIKELRDLGCEFLFGMHDKTRLEGMDYLIKNPGVPIDHELVLYARSLKIPVINEVEVAYSMLPEDVTLIGITGTNGKTTTTTLTYEIMHSYYGNRVHLVGNIGYPFCSIIEDIKPRDYIVMEVSVQQSENLVRFHPDIALITNYSEAHVDFFKTYENYKKTKSKMFYNQESDDIAILNLENEEVLSEMKDIDSNKLYFSSKRKCDCYLENNAIYYKGEKVMDTSIIKIPGMHNIENTICATLINKLVGVPNEYIRETVSKFIGVRHRLEYIDTIDNVRFYNDTEATNTKCTQIALSSFKEPTIIILGGLERGQNFNDLDNYVSNVKSIIAIGTCRDRVEKFALEHNIPCYKFEYQKECFGKINEIMKPGDVVLLSPASASWDQYKECEVRGDEFRDLVFKLKGERNED